MEFFIENGYLQPENIAVCAVGKKMKFEPFLKRGLAQSLELRMAQVCFEIELLKNTTCGSKRI